jgi:hypothetical protein
MGAESSDGRADGTELIPRMVYDSDLIAEIYGDPNPDLLTPKQIEYLGHDAGTVVWEASE